jgi:FMN phosphatase YigB (HAD superfamily)
MPKPKLALLDIDGVLADDRHRGHYAEQRMWFMYFDSERMAADGIWPQGRRLYQRLRRQGWQIRYLTGRREDRRNITTLWLRASGYEVSHTPSMRATGDPTPLANLKLERVRLLVDSGDYSKVVLFDDDPEVIRLVHERLGVQYAVHCTWHVKKKALVRAALA